MKNFFAMCTATLLGVALFSSCSSSRSSITELRGTWSIVDANGIAINNPDAVISFNPEVGVSYGFLGCNPFSASFDTKDDLGEIDLDDMVLGASYCERQNEEINIVSALNQIDRFEVSKDGKSASFYSDNKSVVLRLSKVSEDLQDLSPSGAAAPAASVDTLGKPVLNQLTANDLNGTWEVFRLGQGSELNDRLPNITFDIAAGKVSGFLGCNNFNGVVKFDDPKDTDYNPAEIDFDNIGSTRMSCDNMDVEREFGNALDEAELFGVLSDGTLCLMDSDQVIMAYLRRPVV